MATQGSSDSALRDSGDKPYPAANMLRPFRVRSIRPAGGDGVVRMKRDEYDDLLKRQPRAALRYIDESDGEVILVGSSLELDERLQEHVETAPITNAGVTLDLYAAGNRPMHTFEVDKDAPVIEAWQDLDQRTAAEGQKAKEVFFGRHSATPDNGKQKAEVRFGQVSPPRSALKAPPPVPPKNPHASRWASYSNLPGSFDHEPVSVTTQDTTNAEETAPLIQVAPVVKDDLPISQSDASTQGTLDAPLAPRSAFDIMADATAAPVRSSTLQVPTTPKQKAEHQPLIDMFFTEQKTAKPEPEPTTEPSKEHTKEWQPLLDLFEGQLAELATPSPASDKSPANEKLGESSGLKGPFAQKSGELLTQSIQSLLNGVGLLAATFKKTNLELQQQIALAQQDFPNNIEKALKASVAAIESLKAMIPAANTDSSAPATEPATPRETEQAPTNGAHEKKSADAEAKILLYRYKLQKHILQSKMHPTHDELLMLNEIFKDLEIAWKDLSADTLFKTKIHKVLKRISRMSAVPGDDEFTFKQRSADLVAVWMKTIESHRREERAAAKSKSSSEAAALAVLTADMAAGAAVSSETKPSTKAPTPFALLVPNANQAAKEKEAHEKYVNELEHSHRVEEATEDMRQQLLRMGVLPPAERPLGAVYTRADVLEAYIQKFKELKDEVDKHENVNAEERGPARATLAHGEDRMAKNDQPEASGSRENVEDFYFQTNDHARRMPTQAVDEGQSRHSVTPNPALVPRKAVSFDHLGGSGGPRQVDRADARTWSSTLSLRERLLSQNLRAPNTAQQEPSNHETPPSNFHRSAAGSRPAPEPKPLRHRQSWHPSSTAAATQEDKYPFSFSPQDVMARYPPISQIDHHSQMPTYFRPAPGLDLAGQAPRGILRSGTVTVPNVTAFQPASVGQTAQRSTSTRVTREEVEKRNAERQQKETEWQRRAAGVRERRNRHFPTQEQRAWSEVPEHVERHNNIQKCVEQLTKMGFAQGKADAVATAVMGNLEMALDVLNEDSAAWEAKAKRDEQREMGRGREEVPGSWGSWDDELYG